MRFPTPYGPPVHPVLTKKTFTRWFSIFSPSIFAYVIGERGKNGAPKQAENVASGSVMPRSVPASLIVLPLKEAHIAWRYYNKLIGGRTTDASAVRKILAFGWPGILFEIILLIFSNEYAARVFSVRAASS